MANDKANQATADDGSNTPRPENQRGVAAQQLTRRERAVALEQPLLLLRRRHMDPRVPHRE